MLELETAKANAVETEEYREFTDKFKPKKTTDDCYTPLYIFDVVKDWAVNEYGLEGRPIVRPFYPGGDYENYIYPENGVVIDNPPFSILAKIVDFYIDKNIDFFLFAPTLTLFCFVQNRPINSVIINCAIVYENGANVPTSFVTNMGKYKIHVCHGLNETINGIQKEKLRKDKVTLPTYDFPNELITAARIQKLASHCDLKIRTNDTYFVRALDSQRKHKKAIFGAGFLLSEKAAAEKAAAEVWELSEREKAIIAGLGKGGI